MAKRDTLEGKNKTKLQLTKEFVKKHQILTASMSEGISPLVFNLIQTYEGKGKALDIGCGIGNNCLALLKRNWNVYALDKHQEVLDVFKEEFASMEGPKGKYTTINKDITEFDPLPNKVDLVLAIDVLSYIPPDSLISTILKIRTILMPGGIFMGSFLTNTPLKSDKDIISMAGTCSLDSYSYTNPAIVANILRFAGFHVEACSSHHLFADPSHPARMVDFVARKLP